MPKQFTMTKGELEKLYQAARTPGVFLGGVLKGYSPAKEAVDAIWRKLGKKYGFEWETAKGVSGQPDEIFTAEQEGTNAKNES